MSVQSIALRRLNKVLLPVPNVDAGLSSAKIATFNLNIQGLGYTLSPSVIEGLYRVSESAATLLFNDILVALKEAKGVRYYRPMYPNFPQQVIEASDAELYINAIIHYWSSILVDLTKDPDMILLPKYAKDKREPLDERIELRVLGLATEEDICNLATRIATSNTSISASDKADLRVLFDKGYLKATVLTSVSNKENLAFIGAMFLGTAIDLAPYFKTATDVLRLATALSGGDVSLKDDSKFRNFKGSERRFLLSLLEAAGNKQEDMLRFPARWVRLGERLHPGDYSKRFPTALKAFSVVRNKEHVETFRTHVEAAVRLGSTLQAITLLISRPGEFARRLDHLLRGADTKAKQDRVATAFLGVAHEVSTPVLLQVMAHFQHRDESDLRVAFPKGNVAKVVAIEKPLEELPQAIIQRLVVGIKSTLINRFVLLPELGKVYLDPALKDTLVPFSQRSASKSLRTLVRGSKLALGNNKDTVRFFIWWHDKADGGRVDLDLSAVGFDSDWNHMGHVAYYNLRGYSYNDESVYAVHSGDVVSAPKGASEFIDLNIPAAIRNGLRYIVMTVHGYTEQNFADLPECFAGFMLREKANSGEVYDPRTVVDRADLTSGNRDSVPLIIDLVDRKVIWCDAAMSGSPRYSYHNVDSTRGTIELLGKAFTGLKKPNLYDLLQLHVIARGEEVATKEEADVVFSVEAGTPFELDRIASEFMADAVDTPKRRAASV